MEIRAQIEMRVVTFSVGSDFIDCRAVFYCCIRTSRLLKLLRVLHVLRSLIYIYFVRIAFIEMCIFFIFSFFREAYLDFCLVCYLSSEDLASGFISYSGISIFLTYFKRFFSYVYTSCLYIFLLFYIFAV